MARRREAETMSAGENNSSSPNLPVSASQICPACGTTATRDFAKFCRVCGKILTEEYQPLDALRASYRLQGKSFQAAEKQKVEDLFAENKNSAAATASAFVVYSLVPYLGILFCPGAFLMGGIGAFVSYRKPDLGGRRASIYNLFLSFVIFTIQILLWWLLFVVPELSGKYLSR